MADNPVDIFEELLKQHLPGGEDLPPEVERQLKNLRAYCAQPVYEIKAQGCVCPVGAAQECKGLNCPRNPLGYIR